MEMPVWAKPALVGVCMGAGALAIGGFSFAGWVTGSTAETMAAERASDEVITALTPICVAKSTMGPKAPAILEEVKKAGSYERPSIIMNAGWATRPGATEPDRVLAFSCARTLAESFK